jgi:glycine cleavage system H protein
MNFPENLKYSVDHEWVRTEGEIAYIGISDYAQNQLGEIVFIDVAVEGENVDKNDVFGSIEAVKTVSDLLMPIAGKVIELNADLEDQPELVNADPYGKGWIIKIEVADNLQLNELMSADEYKQFIGE